jgi:beta-glucosidase
VVGDLSGLGAGCTVGESLDSASLRLPGSQQALIESIHATGTPVVLVLVTGRPYDLSWADAHLPAVLEAWFPAQEGGNAIADVLFGDVSPSGRLPISFPRSVGQLPVFYNHKPSGGRSHWQGQYIDSPSTPLYAFGHGLSYTRFSYSDLRLSETEVSPTGSVTVSVRVTNTGDRAGEEVVQLYVSDPIASVTRPVKQLKGFARAALQPGETKTVRFDLDVRHLAFYNADMQFVVEPGEIGVLIGASSEDIRAQASFTIVGEVTPVEQVFTTRVSIE